MPTSTKRKLKPRTPKPRSEWLERFPLDEATGSLVLELKEGEAGIRLDNFIRISIDKVRDRKVKVRIESPLNIKVLRETLLEGKEPTGE